MILRKSVKTKKASQAKDADLIKFAENARRQVAEFVQSRKITPARPSK